MALTTTAIDPQRQHMRHKRLVRLLLGSDHVARQPENECHWPW